MLLVKFINDNYFKKRKNKLKIYRKNNFYKIDIEFSNNKMFTENKDDIKKFEEYVKEFLITLYNNCENFNHRTFLYNFKNSFFYIKRDEKKFVDGSVRKYPDKIVYEIGTFDSCFHELLHLSAIKKKLRFGVLRTGFERFSPPYDRFGESLNEGYTELLTERYFITQRKPYYYEVDISSKLENLVGKNLMEKYYFNSDLKSIIKELEKFGNNVEFFIRKFDSLYNNNFIQASNFDNSNKQMFLNQLKEIYLLLLKMYVNKIVYLKENSMDFSKEYNYLMNIKNWINEKNINYEGQTFFIKTMEEEDYYNVINQFNLIDSSLNNKKIK